MLLKKETILNVKNKWIQDIEIFNNNHSIYDQHHTITRTGYYREWKRSTHDDEHIQLQTQQPPSPLKPVHAYRYAVVTGPAQ